MVNFLQPASERIDYDCGLDTALHPPKLVHDVREISGIYSQERNQVNQNIDTVIRAAGDRYPHIVRRLDSYKAYNPIS